MDMTNIAIFVSGNGTNCENIIRHFAHSPEVCVSLVLSNRPDAYALERAENLGVAAEVVTRQQLGNPGYMLTMLREHEVDFIVLAGFLLMIPAFLIEAYQRRMVNIHPSLLPRHGGKGMYGMHVHEAVKQDGDSETGITIHYVSGECDGGEIIAQFATEVRPDDTPVDIASKVHELEMEHYPEVIERILCNL